jgi:hypothetical protein
MPDSKGDVNVARSKRHSEDKPEAKPRLKQCAPPGRLVSQRITPRQRGRGRASQQARKNRYWLHVRAEATEQHCAPMLLSISCQKQRLLSAPLDRTQAQRPCRTCTYYREQAPPRLREIESNRKATLQTVILRSFTRRCATESKPEDEDIDDARAQDNTKTCACSGSF